MNVDKKNSLAVNWTENSFNFEEHFEYIAPIKILNVPILPSYTYIILSVPPIKKNKNKVISWKRTISVNKS